MLMTLTKQYAALPYEAGTVENLNKTATAELSDSADDIGGITLEPGEKFVFNRQLYARTRYEGMKLAIVESAGGTDKGGSTPEDEIATDKEVDDVLDQYFPGDVGNTAGAGGGTTDGDGPSLG